MLCRITGIGSGVLCLSTFNSRKWCVMIHQFKKRNFYILIFVDTALVALSLLLAYFGRFTFDLPPGEIRRFISILPWVITVKIVVFILMDVYRGIWRYTSLPDAWRLAKASFLATLVIVAGLTVLNRFHAYPRLVFAADCIFTIFLCGSVRAGIRLHYSWRKGHGIAPDREDAPPEHHTRLMLIGAGDAADKIIREVQGNPMSPFQVVCCLDDDVGKHHRALLGIPIRGPVSRVGNFAEKYQASEALIAMPSISGERMREIVGMCEKAGVPFKTLPSLTSLMNGKVSVNDVRPVNYEDLLGRPAVRLDLKGIGQYLAGKTVAVTGAGGSIGSEICRQIVRFNPASLVMIESSEYNLYRLEMELRTERQFPRIFPAMGRVQDRALIGRIFGVYRPQVVFHAAACKHVPMVELNPWEAVYNNVLGSQVVMDMAELYQVERGVFVSTDKAVRPTNVMGASKRIVELLMQTRPPGKTRFMAVRFGNVLGSSGSVIPQFQSQIQAGGPVTVTHPEMTRYFMTIPEACQLVLQAGALGEGGEIFVIEMGTPVKIADLARDLIRLTGKKPDRDIKIIFTGLRPGEKLYEELITHGEGIVPTSHQKIMVLRRNGAGIGGSHETVLQGVEELVARADRHDSVGIKRAIQNLVPEYTPSNSLSVLCRENGRTAT